MRLTLYSPRLGAAALALALAAARLPAQCAMCKESLEAQREAGAGGLSEGISWSILFMLSLPPLIAAGFGLAIWRSYRAQRRRSG